MAAIMQAVAAYSGVLMSSTSKEQESPVDALNSPLAELHKIIASESFSKAPRLCSFLTYIVEKSAIGDLESLSEQQIGINVFKRSPGYNSNDDNIVRGTARSLRQRLSTYYLTEGLQDTVRIEIPKGAYVAQFKDATAELPAVESEPVLGESKKTWRVWFISLAVCVLAIVAILLVVHFRVARPHDRSAVLWDTLFSRDKNTFVVPGDAGLNMYEVLKNRSVDLDSYTQQTYRSNPSGSTDVGEILGGRFYTTMADLMLVTKLVRLPQANPDRVQIRFARDLAARDIKDANLILMGSSSYNPWTELFQSSLSLQMSWNVNQDLFTIVNRTPQPGEQATYQWTVKNGTRGGLTLISLTDNTQGKGRVLLIQGTTMGGVYAAADFLGDAQLLNPILAKAQRPDGSLRNFDVLLQSDFIREGVSNLHILASHVH
jgi:hypothetical protein